jgi:hypothetical protein
MIRYFGQFNEQIIFSKTIFRSGAHVFAMVNLADHET